MKHLILNIIKRKQIKNVGLLISDEDIDTDMKGLDMAVLQAKANGGNLIV